MGASAGMCGLVGLAGVAWTMGALWDDSATTTDTAGLLVGVTSAGLAVWGVWAAVQALREQRTLTVVAAHLTRAVLEEEGKQYRQLLGGDLQALNGPIDLRFTLAACSGAAPVTTEGSMRNIAVYYRSLASGRLVITGARAPGDVPDGAPGAHDAGTGKTVLAVGLVLGLARDRVPDEPVPVRLSASSWSGEALRDWLVRHLAEIYSLRKREARALVDTHLVLPVIDGLDELDMEPEPGYMSRAGDLLRAVERYERAGEKAPVVLTCRRPQYEALVTAETQPQVAAQIEIARVDAESIRAYLTDRVGYSPSNLARWQPLLDAVVSSSAPPALVGALDTPWRLTLAAVVYEERDPRTGVFLRDPKDLVRLAESGELYEHLLDRYVKAALNGPGEPSGQRPRPRLDPDEVWRHLAVLACYLHTNATTRTRTVAGRELSGTDIVLYELWPLAGARSPRVVSSLLVLLPIFLGLGILLLSSAGDSSRALPSVVICGAFGVVASVAAYAAPWPKPTRVSLRPLATLPRFGQAVAAALAGGVLGGVSGGIFYGSFAPPPPGAHADRIWGLIHWPSVPGWMGLVFLLYLTLTIQDQPVSDPRSTLRGDLTVWLFSTVLIAALEYVEIRSEAGAERIVTLSGPLGAVVSLIYGLMVVLGWGFVFSVKDGFPATRGFRGALGGPASLRYVSFLLCTRGRLPWRLSRFLHRCYELGLVRVAGAAYQFRHRELQEHLATRPHPPGI